MPPRLPPSKLHALLTAHGETPTFSPQDPVVRKRNNEESRSQQAVIKWWQMACRGFGVPEILLMSIPNGGGRSGPIVGSILQREGLRTGAPDLLLATPAKHRNGDEQEPYIFYPAMFIEMKTATGRVSPEQEVMHSHLSARGYKVIICRSADQAIGAITGYLT